MRRRDCGQGVASATTRRDSEHAYRTRQSLRNKKSMRGQKLINISLIDPHQPPLSLINQSNHNRITSL